jgi:hypothetical protein
LPKAFTRHLTSLFFEPANRVQSAPKGHAKAERANVVNCFFLHNIRHKQSNTKRFHLFE